MVHKFIQLCVLCFSISAFCADPNLESYKSAGECSEFSKDEKCIYCPLKKKFISLGSNSKDQSPRDSDYEFIDRSEKAQKGTR